MIAQYIDLVHFVIASFWFLLGVSALVIFHELGHYVVARCFRVGVSVFSVGFGRDIASWRRGQTQFKIGMVPFGGYVQLVGSSRTSAAALPQERRHEAFYGRPAHQKVLITLGGPVANIVLAAVMFLVVATYGLDATQPVLAEPHKRSLAYEAGIRLGDRVVGYSHSADPGLEVKPIVSLSEITLLVKDWVIGKKRVALSMLRLDGSTFSPVIDFGRIQVNQSDWRIFAQTGFAGAMNLPVVRGVRWGSAAAEAGIESGDLIGWLDGQPVTDASEILAFFNQIGSPGAVVTVGLLRDGSRRDVQVRPRLASRDDGFEVRPLARLGVSFREAPPIVRLGGDSKGIAGDLKQRFEHVQDYFRISLKQAFVAGPSLSQMIDPFVVQNHAGKAHFHGLSSWIFYLGVVSLALAFFNLLPLPSLDGARLLLYVCEGAAGQEVDAKLFAFFNRGIVLLFLFIVYMAFANELIRMMGPKPGLLP